MSLELFRKFKDCVTEEKVALSPKMVALLFECEASLMVEAAAFEKMSQENKILSDQISGLENIETELKKELEHKEATIEELEEEIKSAQPENLIDEQKRELVEIMYCELSLAELEEIRSYYIKATVW